MTLFHEVNNFLTEEEMEVVDNNILSDEFPWFYQNAATTSNFPFLSHVVYARETNENDDYLPLSNSPLASLVGPMVTRYCNTYLNRPLKQIYRSCLNLSNGWNLDYPFMEPHIDHTFDHYNLIVYLNDFNGPGGETLLFDKYLCDEMNKGHYNVDEYNQLSVLERIQPEKNKAVCFSGKIFHSMANFQSNERRVILVTTFI